MSLFRKKCISSRKASTFVWMSRRKNVQELRMGLFKLYAKTVNSECTSVVVMNPEAHQISQGNYLNFVSGPSYF